MARRKNDYVENKPSNVNKVKKRKKKRRVSKKFRLIISYLLILTLVISTGIILSLTVLFKVDRVEVEGESRYSKEDIINASGMYTGENLFLCNTKKGIETLEKKFSYLENIDIKRVIPSKILIVVKEAIPENSVETNGKYAIISKSQKVLEIRDEPLPGITLLKGVNINSAELSSKVEFKDSSRKNLLSQVSDVLDANNIIDNITQIDLTNVAKITVWYNDRIEIVLGTSNDLDYKVRTAMAIIKEKISEQEEGTLDVSLSADDNRSYFRPNYDDNN